MEPVAITPPGLELIPHFSIHPVPCLSSDLQQLYSCHMSKDTHSPPAGQCRGLGKIRSFDHPSLHHHCHSMQPAPSCFRIGRTVTFSHVALFQHGSMLVSTEVLDSSIWDRILIGWGSRWSGDCFLRSTSPI